MQKRIAALIVASAALVGFMEEPAHSATGIWDTVGNWEVYGDSETLRCVAMTTYQSGHILGISFYGDREAALSVGNVNVTPGQAYDILFVSSRGDKGTLSGIAVSNSVVAFPGLTGSALDLIANAHGIRLGGIGAFDLTDSKAAMAGAWDCYEALNII